MDLTDAPRKILHARLTIPVQAGPLTLEYPAWIPGEHAPDGPIDNLAGLSFEANGHDVPWSRDSLNMFQFHLNIPAGAAELHTKLDFLATAAASGFSAGASTGPNLAIVNWNQFTLSRAGAGIGDVVFAPSITVPPDWQFGSALRQQSREGNTIHFAPVSLETLVDSPLLAGRYFKEIPLAPEISPKHYLDLAADGPEDLAIGTEQLDSFQALIREATALYRFPHYTGYHFLVALSDSIAHFGLEHHESSDDRMDARSLIDEDLVVLDASLLPHEYTHSWNGKFRRPVGLITANFQQPMKSDLLWVYEGLTEYLSTVLTVRSGLWSKDQFLANLAHSAAEMNARPGRTWRNLQDTATAAQTLYATSDAWDNWRRSVDYYAEGALIWLEADVTIRRLSGGQHSLDEFCARFLGGSKAGGPEVSGYTFNSLVSELNAIQPYDWAAFFHQRLNSKDAAAPLGGILDGGYKLDFSESANEITRATEAYQRGVNAWYSLGFKTSDQTIDDVLPGSPADRAGLGPGMKLVAINGRRATDELLHNALKQTKTSHEPMEFIVENQGFFKVVKLDYHSGERYPQLIRTSKTPGLLDMITQPLTAQLKQAGLE